MADNHSWTDQRNWSPQGVPGAGDSVAHDVDTDDIALAVDRLDDLRRACVVAKNLPQAADAHVDG